MGKCELNVECALVILDVEKAEILNAFFTLVFTSKTGLQKCQTLETRGTIWSREDITLVQEDQVREYLSKLNAYKSMGPNGMHTGEQKELADVILKSLLITFKQSQRLREVPRDWKKANITPILKKGKKEDPGNYRSVSLPPVSGMVMEQLIPGSIFRHMRDKKCH